MFRFRKKEVSSFLPAFPPPLFFFLLKAVFVFIVTVFTFPVIVKSHKGCLGSGEGSGRMTVNT